MPSTTTLPAYIAVSGEFDYVRTIHRDGTPDYGVWHGYGGAPLNRPLVMPGGGEWAHYIGRIHKREPFSRYPWFATPDDGDHSWAGLRWYGRFTTRHDAAVFLAGYRAPRGDPFADIRTDGDPKWIPHAADMTPGGTCGTCGAEAGNPEHVSGARRQDDDACLLCGGERAIHDPDYHDGPGHAMVDPPFWGACGVEGCRECLPLFDAENEPIRGTEGWSKCITSGGEND